MPLLPEKLLTPEEEELARKKAALSDLEAQIANRELELASFRADLLHFEKRYLQTMGRRYAILDELKAKIAEARAGKNPHNQDARNEARQARSKAKESARAVGQEKPEAPLSNDAASPSPKRSETLRNLYRQAAKLLHPDLTLDGEEKKRRHRLMGEINEAYARGDEERIRAILRESNVRSIRDQQSRIRCRQSVLTLSRRNRARYDQDHENARRSRSRPAG